MATDTTSVGAVAIGFITGGGVATLAASLIGLIPSSRSAKQAALQYELEKGKARDAEEIALRAELRATHAENDSLRRRLIDAEEALFHRRVLCDKHGGYCMLEEEKSRTKATGGRRAKQEHEGAPPA